MLNRHKENTAMATMANQNPPELVVTEVPPSRPTTVATAVVRRVSWSAIIAGVLLAVMAQITMNILGLAIGAAALDVDAPRNAIGPTFSTGAVVWMGVSTMLSLFVGGYVAARLSGNSNRGDAMLHGLIVWALSTLLSFLVLWATASSIVSGVSGLLSEGVSLIGANIEDVAPQVANALDMQTTVFDSINEQASRTGIAADAPANTQLMFAMNNLLRLSADSPEAEEARNTAISLLTSQGMSDAEARNQITAWENQYRQAVSEAQRLGEEATQNIADATAITGSMLFLMMILGAFAGGAGGVSGRPRRTALVRRTA
jgi:hypothetical protein